MKNCPDLVVTYGDPLGLINRLSGIPGFSLSYIHGFITPEDCDAWFANEPTLFDEIVGWCEINNWSSRVWIDRDDISGLMVVGNANSTDAVMFRLRWADHLIDTEASRYLSRGCCFAGMDNSENASNH